MFVFFLQKYIKIFGFLRLVNKKVKTMLIFTGRNEVCAILHPQVTLCLTGLVSQKLITAYEDSVWS